jgi:hypothetical protein
MNRRTEPGTRCFTDALRCELRHDRSRVQVTSVHLPALNTPQFDWIRSHGRFDTRAHRRRGLGLRRALGRRRPR